MWSTKGRWRASEYVAISSLIDPPIACLTEVLITNWDLFCLRCAYLPLINRGQGAALSFILGFSRCNKGHFLWFTHLLYLKLLYTNRKTLYFTVCMLKHWQTRKTETERLPTGDVSHQDTETKAAVIIPCSWASTKTVSKLTFKSWAESQKNFSPCYQFVFKLLKLPFFKWNRTLFIRAEWRIK